MSETQPEQPATPHQPQWQDRFAPRNPLGIIALFVFLIEAVATVSLKFVVGTGSEHILVWFIILYPTFIASAFFVFLRKKREAFYSPYDFRSDTLFQELLRKVEVLDAKQEAAKIDESTRSNEVLEAVPSRRMTAKEVQSVKL